MMDTYNEKLDALERESIERALDVLGEFLPFKLANDDRAARAAEALAVYIVESKAPR